MSELINIEVIEPTPVPVIEIHVDLNAAQSAIDAAAQAQLILNEIAALVGGSSFNTITTLGTFEIDGDQITFSGFAWKINGTDYAQAAPITRTLPFASEGMYRTHVAYFTTTNDINIVVGPESEEVTTEPNIPAGTLRMRAFNVFGESITAGPGVSLPFDMTTLDELLELDPDADIWMNINGLDVRAKVNLLLDFMLAIATDVVNSLDFLTIKILASAPATPTANTIRFYSIANTVAAIFPDGLQISFVKNTTQNGTVTMPFHSGRMELIRPIQNITGTTTYNFQETDVSRGCRVASGNMDFVIPSSVSGNHKYLVVNESTGTVRITTAGTYRINGAFDPITLPQGEFYITRTANLNFIVTLPGVSGSSEWIIASSNYTASNNDRISVVDNCTITDPTPVEGKGYEVKISQGIATIGEENFSSGYLVHRTYRNGEWFTQSYMNSYTILESFASFLAALNKRLCVFASATVPIVTNNATSETIIAELTIPANSWRNQTTFRLQTLNILGATAAGTKQFQFRVSATSGVLGTLLARFNTTTTSAAGIPFARRCSIYDNKINSNVAASTSLLDNEGINTPGGNPEISIDMTAPIYIQFTISMPNNADTLTTQDVKCLGLY
ncbi:MAG: hypothetical protein J0M25_00665 [Flavobacteriales bacterium]|nr:hypothetical protein [Flavobacteriales bacterium]